METMPLLTHESFLHGAPSNSASSPDFLAAVDARLERLVAAAGRDTRQQKRTR